MEEGLGGARQEDPVAQVQYSKDSAPEVEDMRYLGSEVVVMIRSMFVLAALLLLQSLAEAQAQVSEQALEAEYGYCYGTSWTHPRASPDLRVQLWVTPVFIIDLVSGKYPDGFIEPQSQWNDAFHGHVQDRGLHQPSMHNCFKSYNEELTHRVRAMTHLGSSSIHEVLEIAWWPTISRRILDEAPGPFVDWEVSFTLGAAVSTAVSHKYGTTGDQGQYVVERFPDTEDQFTQSLIVMAHATFVDPFPFRRNDWINVDFGPSFGISESPHGNENYYFGISLHFGHRMYVTLGYNWSDVLRLPPGLVEGSSTAMTSEELTAKLVPSTHRGGFLAFSIPIAGSRDGFINFVNRGTSSSSDPP